MEEIINQTNNHPYFNNEPIDLNSPESAPKLDYGPKLTSPYPRNTHCEIEIDCNCLDILNVYERPDIVEMLSLSKGEDGAS